ncbi:MAG: aminoglycoside phosphotransferase family protein [Clostridia bacterium]|nr:aminoglycoside phosphotransferase family protein [Clostridia bacterium]
MKDDNLNIIANKFMIEGRIDTIMPFGNGHINNTFLVTTSNKRYILQRISDAFDVTLLMKNIDAVTSFMALKSDNPDRQMKLIHTSDNKNYYSDESGNYRMYTFVEGSICLEAPESTNDFYESALAFGNFQKMLEDFPAETLFEPIKDFHNTPNRYKIFKETILKDKMDRVKEVKEEIDFALSREKEAGILQNLRDTGKLPTRVTHNDTKLNNVLFDKDTRKSLCVIDLDTVMPGLSLYDFGDAIRFGAATAKEDEKDLSKMTINLDMFRAFTRGYLQSCNLTGEEIENIVLGSKTMTLECGVRFLTDYLDGDNYFRTSYAGQNLDRCRTQFKLVGEIEKNTEKMGKIVKEELSKIKNK